MNQNEIISVLKMDKIVFDKIEFNRFGFKNENKINMELTTSIGKNEGENTYKVSLILKGNKKDEYNLSVILTGYFSFNLKSDMDITIKDTLISKNAVAILLPYMRSEVSLLTAQPDVDVVNLPIFNVNNMLEK